MYERDAITSHIKVYGSDPKTRVPLRSDQLTPVYLVRARASEYRETAAAACVEAASSPGCPDPVGAGASLAPLVGDIFPLSDLHFVTKLPSSRAIRGHAASPS